MRGRQRHRLTGGVRCIGRTSYSCRIGRADTSGAMAQTAKTSGLKSIISACPIHGDCVLEVIFGPEEDGRIPFPDPALRPMAEYDFPGLVPIEARHLSRRRPALMPSGAPPGSTP